ncbi:ABC transporter ATP-binding protein [Kitasatospora sp. SUK 42]|uniref:ABC transporter ATP-binding protein n=1 Tax=Kitasatospora sp. SUK 42 TaxID=1588882 RepID=UPI0018C9F788|nr:ATP-binding cassette domain-containing protein [Kitasatospora sp. SUK 42]MBV2151776.1 ATP-binding cassette domain-containing protein [Kitasatospora sp. SUK 42]
MSAAPPDNDVVWARGIVKSHYGTPALRGISIGVRDGEVLAVTGPRGSGKSTLLGCLSAQLAVDEGEVWFNSSPVHTLGRAGRERLRRDRFGFVGSEPHLVPELTARENVALPLLLAGAGNKAAYTAADEWLERLDVGDVARQRPDRLVQGQCQRIAVARALAPLPPVVFADDPTAPLHREAAEQVLRILTSAARSHQLTLVLATHDPELVRFADRAVALVDGRLTAPAAPVPRGTPAQGTPGASAVTATRR